jgi:transposase
MDACSILGDKGVLLRREGLYSSTVTRWRQQMARKTKVARGRPNKSPLQEENEEMKRQLDELQGRLERAETIIDVQKKLSSLLEPLSRLDSSERSN